MAFTIEIRFLGGLTETQIVVFETAANRWSEIITESLPPVQLANGDIVNDVRIDAQGVSIDGPSGILGQAGPTQLRPGSFLPATGMMRFDSADLARMEAESSLMDVIVHEMGHVLGFGTLWSAKFLNLIEGEGFENPVFLGKNTIREYRQLTNDDNVSSVPVANTGGKGTRDGHWREMVFDNELMTGFIDLGDNPLSRLSVAAFDDMGYNVDYDAADTYRLPAKETLALKVVDKNRQCRMCSRKIMRTDPVVLPESCYL